MKPDGVPANIMSMGGVTCGDKDKTCARQALEDYLPRVAQ